MKRARRRVDSLTRTAYHEAGHAVLSAAISDTPQCVSIRHEGHTLGRVRVEAITQKRDVANMRSAASSCNNLAKHRLLLRQTIALSAAEIPRFGVLASSPQSPSKRPGRWQV